MFKPSLLALDKTGKLREWWSQQRQALQTSDLRSMRWNSTVLHIALSVYIRSSSAYEVP